MLGVEEVSSPCAPPFGKRPCLFMVFCRMLEVVGKSADLMKQKLHTPNLKVLGSIGCIPFEIVPIAFSTER